MSIELDHLGIAVPNIEESLHFYEELLGLAVQRHETVESERVNVAILPLNGSSSGSRIELLEPTDADSTIGKFVNKRGPGLHHVALRVDDLALTIERLKSKGARLLNEPRTGAGGHTYVFVHPGSTGGVLLELIQK
jgi:methylmalonyl-CoA epimerase